MYPNGDKYFGQAVDGKRQGKGLYIWPTGAKYFGDYVDDWRTNGVTYLSNGNVEHGRYEKGVFIGQ